MDNSSLPSVSNVLQKWTQLANQDHDGNPPVLVRASTAPVPKTSGPKNQIIDPEWQINHSETLPVSGTATVTRADPAGSTETRGSFEGKALKENSTEIEIDDLQPKGKLNCLKGDSQTLLVGDGSSQLRKKPPAAPPKPARLSRAQTNYSDKAPDSRIELNVGNEKALTTGLLPGPLLQVTPPSIQPSNEVMSASMAMPPPRPPSRINHPISLTLAASTAEKTSRPTTPRASPGGPPKSPRPPPPRGSHNHTPVPPPPPSPRGTRCEENISPCVDGLEEKSRDEGHILASQQVETGQEIASIENAMSDAHLQDYHAYAHSATQNTDLKHPQPRPIHSRPEHGFGGPLPPPLPSRNDNASRGMASSPLPALSTSSALPAPMTNTQLSAHPSNLPSNHPPSNFSSLPPSLPPRPHDLSAVDDGSSPSLPPRPAITSMPSVQSIKTSIPIIDTTPVLPVPAMQSQDQDPNTRPVPPLRTDESELPEYPTDMNTTIEEDLSNNFLDSSQANRREPLFEGVIHEAPSKGGEPRCAAINGQISCIALASTLFLYDIVDGTQIWSHSLKGDTRITAIGFVDHGNQIWLGTKTGLLMTMSVDDPGRMKQRKNVHMQSIVHIGDHDGVIWTFSEDGKICLWQTPEVTSVPKPFRVTPNFKAFAIGSGNTLWVGRNKQIFVYQPSLDTNSPFLLTPRPIAVTFPLKTGTLGELSCGGSIPDIEDYVFFGHEDGKISIYSQSRLAIVSTVNISIHKITALYGTQGNLWIGQKTGYLHICDVRQFPWKVVKEWKPHETSVFGLSGSKGQDMWPVCSIGGGKLFFWDGLLKRDWIEADLQQHEDEYSSFNDLSVKIVTWNAGACKPADLESNKTDKTFIEQSLFCEVDPDIIVFGFQELVELDDRAVTAKTMFLNKKKDSEKKVSTASHISPQYKDWQDYLIQGVSARFGTGSYQLIQSSNMVGLFTCVFMKTTISNMRLRGTRSSEFKTGLGGLHGNKGGIAVRVIVDDSSICFVNCHLAAGQSGTLHRNKDIETILDTRFLDEAQNTKYMGKGIFVNGGDGTKILDHDVVFLSGDMNYRINLMRPVVMRALDDGQLKPLLENDQLMIQLKKNPGFRLRQFQEAPITFRPTYKFDVGTDNYDTSEKKRVPAWCDRIFYRASRSDRVKALDYDSIACRTSDHRPVAGFYMIKVKYIDSHRRAEVYKQTLQRWKDRN